MSQISGNSLDKFNKSCSALHQESNKIDFAFFLIFLRFSRDFTRISKVTLLLKMHLCNEVPRTFPTITNMPRDRTKHPGRNWGLAIGSLAWGRRRLRPDSGGPAALLAGEVVGLDHMLTWGTGVAEVGAGKSTARVHGEDRRRRPWRVVLPVRNAPGLPTSEGYAALVS
jgi:hypothetical protein